MWKIQTMDACRCMAVFIFALISFSLYIEWKVSKYEVFSGPHFPVFELNMEIYSVNLRTQSEYGKMWTGKEFVIGRFSRNSNSLEWRKIFW